MNFLCSFVCRIPGTTEKMSFEKRKKSHGKPLDKAQRIKYYKQATETKQVNKKKAPARFYGKRTLTTEEWKAELELEQVGLSDAHVQFLSIMSFTWANTPE